MTPSEKSTPAPLPGPPPAWLADYQLEFTKAIRAPLDRSKGTLRSVAADKQGSLVQQISSGPMLGAAERLAVYNRQYWCRLFSVMQSEYPLVSRLVGYWFFNELAAQFLLKHPPCTADIQEAADGFFAFLQDTLLNSLVQPQRMIERRLVVQAAAVDEAFREAFRAPVERAYEPSAADAAKLGTAQLHMRRGFTIIEQSYPLVQLRKALSVDTSESPPPLPEKLKATEHWLIGRAPSGALQLQLEETQAKLYHLCIHMPVGEALARLESAVTKGDRSGLPSRVRVWLAQSVKLGLWSSIE
ncbi:MAG: putative DNA-binding domain-containing protein [Polyangiaceae bacterium]|nr:putative DNA-binding domain-containing protein [Polyangiaceae bacterium]